MDYANVKSEVLDYLGEFADGFGIAGIMEAIRRECPDAKSIDDIDYDTFLDIIEAGDIEVF